MKEDFCDFLKTAYKYNKVKDLKEAFEEYPVEEEWHKGKIEEYKKSFYYSLKSLNWIIKIFTARIRSKVKNLTSIRKGDIYVFI